MKNLTRLLPFLIAIITVVQSANILAILPMVQKSHYVMYKSLIEELVNRGHTVDLLGGVHALNGVNKTGLNIIDIPDIMLFKNAPRFRIKDMREITINIAVNFIIQTHGTSLCEDVFEMDVTKNLRDSEKKYDLLLIEIFNVDCFYGFAHVFKVPTVSLISSTDLPWGAYRIGNPDNPSYIPNYFQGFRPDKSLLERLLNTVSYVQTKVGHWWFTREQDKVARDFFGQDMPNLHDIVANTSILLMNSHFSLNTARPTVPNLIEVGGLHISGKTKPLDKSITNFIGNQKFIYFSLGTLALSETFESHILKYFIDTFAELRDYKILWKANRTEIEKQVDIPSNVLIQSWMPQFDILCHPNNRLFIAHSGLLGTQEAVYCGVPMLCLPLFADQYQNCRNMVDKEVAATLQIETMTKHKLRNTIRELVDNPRYAQNAKMLSKKFKDRPLSAMDTAMYWINYVIEHKGADHMKTPSINLKWYQYYLIDVISILTLTLLLCTWCVYSLMKYVVKKLISNSKQKNKSE